MSLVVHCKRYVTHIHTHTQQSQQIQPIINLCACVHTQALIDQAADLGVESVVIGMPHRGRLNVLANVVRKPMRQIFTEFTGKKLETSVRTASRNY